MPGQTSIQIVIEAIDRARDVLVQSQQAQDGLNTALKTSIELGDRSAASLRNQEAALSATAAAQQRLATATSVSAADASRATFTTGAPGPTPRLLEEQALIQRAKAAEAAETSRLLALTTAESQRVAAFVASLGTKGEATTTKLRGNFGELGKEGESTFKKIGEAGTLSLERIGEHLQINTLLAGGLLLALAAIPAKLAFSVEGIIETADRFAKLSEETGLTAEQISALELEFEKSARGAVNLDRVVRALGLQIRTAIANPASEAANRFLALGISQQQLVQSGNDLSIMLPLIARGFDTLEKGTARATLANDLFGRGGARIIPSLERMKDGFGGIAEASQKAGTSISQEFAIQSEKLSRTFVDVQQVMLSAALVIAREVVPALQAVSNFIKGNQESIRNGLLVVAGAITSIGVAALAIRSFGLIKLGVTFAVGGSEAIKEATTLGALLLAVSEKAKNTALAFNLVKVAASGALVVTPVGLFVVAIGTLLATLAVGVQAWKAFKASKDDALSLKALSDNNAKLRETSEAQIKEAERLGEITAEKAEQMRKKIADAFAPQTVTETVPAVPFASPAFSTTRTFIDQQKGNDAAREQLKLLIQQRDVLQQIALLSNVTSEARIAALQADFAVFKTEKDIQTAELDAAFARAGSKISAAQFANESKAILIDVFERQRVLVEEESRLRVEEIRRKASESPIVRAKPPAEQAALVEQITISPRLKEESDLRTKLADLDAAFQKELIKNADKSISDQIAKRKELATAEIEQLKLTRAAEEAINAESAQRRLEFEQTTLKGIEDGLDKEALRFKFNEAEKLRTARETFEAKRVLLQQDIDFESAQAKTRLSVAQADPTGNLLEKQLRVNSATEDYIQLLLKQIDLNDEIIRRTLDEQGLGITSVENTQKQNEALIKNIELRGQIVGLRRSQVPAEEAAFPQFTSALGFQPARDKLTGEIIPGVIELKNQFAALDTFLSTTLQNTFSGLSNAITGLITGTQSWAQVWTQVGNQIIGSVIQLILEYTIFHNIRMLLDRIFFTAKQTQITATSAVASTAAATTAATTAASAAPVAAAWSPAAIFASIGSFGAAGIIGLAVVLAALGAVAAGAFSKGGKIPGSPSNKDDKVAAVASGELIISALSTAKLEQKFGQAGIEKLLAGELPVAKGDKPRGAEEIRSVNALSMQKDIIDLIKLSSSLAFARAAKFADGGILPYAGSKGRESVPPFPASAPAWGFGGVLRGPGGPRDDKIPIWVSAGEGILTASSVNYYTPAIVHAINAKLLPREIALNAAMSVFSGQARHFASGGIVERHFSTMRFADGGIVNNSLVSSTVSDRELRTVEQQMPVFNPTINVAPAQQKWVIANTREEMRRFMEEEGNDLAFQRVKRGKVELGIRA